MKGIFIVYENIENECIGINKKINAQIENFRACGMEVNAYQTKCIIPKGYKILYRLPFTNLTPTWEYDTLF